MDKKKIAIIGASDMQNPLILKAKEMGFETHVFAWKAGAIGETTADYFYPISITEKEKIADKCLELGVCAAVSVASDLAVPTVNYVLRKLGIPCNSEHCDTIATNKYLMRCACKAHGVAAPGFMKADANTDLSNFDLTFPVIVKPTDRSGSRGIRKVYEPGKLRAAVLAASEISWEKSAIIEEYIEGKEYSCESITYNGKHTTLALTEKFTTEPYYIEVAHKQPAPFSDEKKHEIITEIHKALTAIEITNSASHAEFKVTPSGKVVIVEIGPRVGGGFIGTDLVKLSTGYDFTEMAIDIACGKAPDFTKHGNPRPAGLQFIMTEKDYQDYLKFKKEHPENIIRERVEHNKYPENPTDESFRSDFYIYVH